MGALLRGEPAANPVQCYRESMAPGGIAQFRIEDKIAHPSKVKLAGALRRRPKRAWQTRLFRHGLCPLGRAGASEYLQPRPPSPVARSIRQNTTHLETADTASFPPS